MTHVISFRATDAEARIVEAIRRKHRLGTRADAVRFLVRQAAPKEERPSQSLAFQMHIPGLARPGEILTSESIDEELYGDGP